MQFGHDELGVVGYLVNSGDDGHEAVSLKRQPRAELLRCEPHRVLPATERENRPVPNCHPDPNDFLEPHPTTVLGLLSYRHTMRQKCPIPYVKSAASSAVSLAYPMAEARSPGPR